MSLKEILSKPIPKSKKNILKVVHTTEDIHAKVSLLSELLGITKSQALNNIITLFIKDNEDEIKDLITLKKEQLDQLF